MTVDKLIQFLKRMPPNAKVCLQDRDNEADADFEVEKVMLLLDEKQTADENKLGLVVLGA